ncbi:lycopene cyclase family protein [Vibrio sp. WXL210]|uniref:lycopene cyclase family protein n=1 Tax=Vibrio sp. WXL210 TaxID=3450709 RepID=UPI003EC4E03D
MQALKADIVMLGIGLSSCSLALALLEKGYRGDIVMLEREARVNSDKTWCFWDGEHIPHYLRPLICKSWPSWQIADITHKTQGGSTSYACIRATDFFHYCLAQLSSADNITLLFNSDIHTTGEQSDGVTVYSNTHTIVAKMGFDSRFQAPATSTKQGLLQCFSGAWIVSASAQFSDCTAKLMVDIKAVEGGTQFLYLLPFDKQSALVEITRFASQPVSRSQLETETLAALTHLGLSAHDIITWEHGVLPMTVENTSTVEPSQADTPPFARWHSIGIRGHCIRAATGYAFTAIQRSSVALAKQIVLSQRASPPRSPRYYQWLDGVFLHVLRNEPQRAPEIFARLAQGTTPEQFSRFMSEQANWRDILAVINCMPKWLFMRAALKVYL